jgi:hypothetical protein
MKTRMAVTAVVVLAFATVALAGPPSPPPVGPLQERHVAVGAWHLVWYFPDKTETIAVVHGDGTVVIANDTNDFVGGYTSESINAGQWRINGPRGAVGTVLTFIFDGNGAHILYYKMIMRGEVDEDGVMAAEFDLLVYLPSQDPLDPDEIPIQAYTGITATGRRITP